MSPMARPFVGTSGFASPLSRSSIRSLSASAPDLLASYARRLDSVEMESSFNRAPSTQTVCAWKDATYDDFTFAVRVPRDATHVQRLETPERVRRFVETLSPLGPRLGCVLVTTPESLECDAPRVRAVLDALPPRTRTAWEFRHPSWLCPEVAELLQAHNATPALVESLDGVSFGDVLPGGEWEVPFVYARFRRARYLTADILGWGKILGEVIASGRDVFAFFRQSPEATSYSLALAEVLAEAAEPPPTTSRAGGGW